MRLMQLSLFSLTLMLFPSLCSAQGILWNLPEVGTQVNYEGTVSQELLRDPSVGENLSHQWEKQLELRCVGEQQAEFEGQTVDCRWIEIESKTGTRVDGNLDMGPGAHRILKLLVPVNAVSLKLTKSNGLPKTTLPILKGYQLIDQGTAEPISSNYVSLYPLISQVSISHHAEQATGASESVGVDSFESEIFRDKTSEESKTRKIENQTQVTVGPEMPFGAMMWEVEISTYSKGASVPVDGFVQVSTLTEQMQAVSISQNAQAAISAQ